MQSDTFQFILNSELFTIPSLFKHMMDISPLISKHLIFSTNHQYIVKSKVRKEVFQTFLDYLVADSLPDIQIDTFNDYLQLTTEFCILKDYVEQRKNQLGEYLVNLNGLRDIMAENFPFYAEKIAANMDDYLERYGDELMKSSIQSLSIVFNHKKRKLNNHNLAYDLIKKTFEKTNDSSVFILLESLDGSKLTRGNLEESFSMREERMNYMPNVDFRHLAGMIEKQRLIEERVLAVEKKIQENQMKYEEEKKLREEEHEKSINEILMQQKEEISEIQKKHSEEVVQLNETIDLLKVQINEMKEKLENIDGSLQTQKTEITKVNEQVDNINKMKFNEKIESINKIIEKHSNLLEGIGKKFGFLNVELSMTEPGILQRLKEKQKTPFDRLFVASQSSRDLYNLIDPNTSDDFRGSPNGDNFIEFLLEQEVTVNGVKIYSSFEYFPKSFDIEIDGNVVKSVKEANELNGQNKEMIIEFDPIRCRKFKFIQTGLNWDDNSKYIRIKRIELLSNEYLYSDGVFSTIVNKCENKDPHKSPVFITASYFDLNKFHSLDVLSCQNICTYDKENSWFQIELTKGFVVLDGFRLYRAGDSSSINMKNYKIICTDDSNKPENSWTTLIEINEKERYEHKATDIYKFPQSSPPVKFIRIIQTGETWENDNYLIFFHFDIFGVYL